MGSSIFADESGDESARDGGTASGEHSVFRRPGTDEPRRDRGTTDDQPSVFRQPEADVSADGDSDAVDGSTMTVFGDGTTYEFVVEDDS